MTLLIKSNLCMVW